MHPTSFPAEASRSSLPTLRTLPPLSGETLPVVVEADDADNLLTIPDINPWVVLGLAGCWCYGGALLVNAVFPL